MNIKQRVLWLEVDQDLRKIFADELDPAVYNVRLVPTIEQFNTALPDAWDLIILDLQLGDEDWAGLDALADLRRYNQVTPVIVCTGRGTKRETRRAMQLGADDVVFKEDILQELSPSVRKALDIV